MLPYFTVANCKDPGFLLFFKVNFIRENSKEKNNTNETMNPNVDAFVSIYYKLWKTFD